MASSKISEFFKNWFGPDDIHLGQSNAARNRAAAPRPSTPRSTTGASSGASTTTASAARPLERLADRPTISERATPDRTTVTDRTSDRGTSDRAINAGAVAGAAGLGLAAESAIRENAIRDNVGRESATRTDEINPSEINRDEFNSSELRGSSPTAASNVERLRFRGARGGIIARHRSMRTVEMPRSEILISIALAVGATVAWVLVLPFIMDFWRAMIATGASLMGLPGQLRVENYRLGPIDFDLPSLALPSATPDTTMWWGAAIVTVVLFLLSYLLIKRSVPLAYMLRAMMFVQFCSLAYFIFWPSLYPYGLEDYMANMLMASLAFLTCIPLGLALTYYIFDLGLLKKVFLTLLTLAHLCILAPLQYLVHVYLIYHGSLLFMPVLYLVFGLPLSVMSLVAFYSWGMSWKSRNVPQAT